MRPELPYFAAGAVAIVGGTVRDKGWPSEGINAILGTLVLGVVASASAGTRIAPLVHAIGLLLLLASVLAAVNSVNSQKGKK